MKSCDIWNELGETYFRTNEPEKALEAYTRAIELGVTNGKTFTNLAGLNVQYGKYAQAVPLYQMSLELLTNPEDLAENWIKLGSVYHHLNEHGKAIQAYQKSSEFSGIISSKNSSRTQAGISSQAVNEQSEVHGEINLPENSESIDREHSELFTSAVQNADPSAQENPSVWNELGLVLFKVGAYEDAIDAYKKAIDLDPKCGYFYSNIGQVLVSQGRLVDAMEIFEHSIKLLPGKMEKAVSWTRLSDIYRQLGRIEEAAAATKMTEILNRSAQLPANDFRYMKLEQIDLDADEVRNQESLDELASSIRIHGIIQP
ncbi:MAG: tetratricopeptide repeat protein, partial [Chloroflexota bacterium]